ncbi:uncharacterized protein [Chironomus tepperi]|uniref:uncharacterized protein n=1 Tax=Chironomus tepperi TaxID=113505 RepID=UPI00391F3D28
MMKFHHFLKLLIIATLVIASKAADEDVDYDAGYIELHEELPKPQPQVSQPKVAYIDDIIMPKESGFNPFKSVSFSEASVYIPVAVISGVLLNAIIITALVVLKRRRVSSYRKLQLNRTTPVFKELQTEAI